MLPDTLDTIAAPGGKKHLIFSPPYLILVANLNIVPIHEKVNNPEREVKGGCRQT